MSAHMFYAPLGPNKPNDTLVRISNAFRLLEVRDQKLNFQILKSFKLLDGNLTEETY